MRMQRYFSHAQIAAVLAKLGVESAERMDEFDQDAQYTACHASELHAYFELYRSGKASAVDRGVLCCFIMESLNDLISERLLTDAEESILMVVLDSSEHRAEIAYWAETSEPEPDNWWPITHAILRAKPEVAANVAALCACWDGSEDGWSVMELEHAEWVITVEFPPPGATVGDVAKLRRIVPELATLTASAACGLLNGAVSFELPREFGNIEHRRVLEDLKDEGITARSHGRQRGGFSPMRNGKALLIESDDVRARVVANMLRVGVPVQRVHVD